MAKSAIEQSLGSGENLKKIEVTYDEAHALQNLVGHEFKNKIEKETKKRENQIKQEMQEIWNNSVQESKKHDCQ